MRTLSSPYLIMALLLASVPGPAVAQHVCDDPPSLTVLTGVGVLLTGSDSEGSPSSYSWYVTPPGSSVSTKPTTAGRWCSVSPDIPGLWSVAMVADYDHEAPTGGLWSSNDCITILAASVVASIGLSTTQISIDEEVQLIGNSSRWAPGVTPEVEWLIDGLALGACNGDPPPTSPDDIACAVHGSWFAPGWHTAGLRLTDPASGDSSLATTDFEIIEIVPLSVDFGWSPIDPDPGDLVHYSGAVTPQIPEQDFTRVIWELGDGSVETHTSCPLFYGSCLESPHSYGEEGWYDVTVTVETVDETTSRSYRVEIGDPGSPPVASISPSPSSPLLLESTRLNFDGSCEGQCQWLWDFGDGSQSVVESPNHVWKTPGTYTVSVFVTNLGGSDSESVNVEVSNCWSPASPAQQGSCYGGPVFLTAAPGRSWLWNTGATTRIIGAPFAGSYWVNTDSASGCWGHAPSTIVLDNCGSPEGDANLDSRIDAADVSALLPELTDGDGDAVTGAGGGDLSAPGGDVNRDFVIRADDLLTVLIEVFD